MTKIGSSGARGIAVSLLCWILCGCAGLSFGGETSARGLAADDVAAAFTPGAPVDYRRTGADRESVSKDMPGTSFLFKQADDDEPDATARLQIYTAQLELEVPRVDTAIATCRAVTEEFGGFLASRASNTITCRVPAARFEEFLVRMRELGRVIDESMQAADVTDQHRDLGIRLENARNARTRLLALLEKAEKVEDVLAIERELQRLTEEIERAEAQLAALDDRIALSTITVQLRAPRDAGPGKPRQRQPSPFGWLNEVGVDEVLRWE